MTNTFESESFLLPSEVKKDVTDRLKDTGSIRGLEFLFRGDALEGAKEFTKELVALKKQGVKISHEFTIKLSFPRSISRRKALELVERMPKPTNGSVKVKIQFDDVAPATAVIKPQN